MEIVVARHSATVNPSPLPPPTSGDPPNMVEAPALSKRRWNQVEEELLEEGSEKKPETPRATRYPPPKRRRVSAVRSYPAGSGFTVVAFTPPSKTESSDAEEPEEEEEEPMVGLNLQRYPPPKRRRVSAVRSYPAGSGFTVVACKTEISDAEEPEEDEAVVVHQQPGDGGCVQKLERIETKITQGFLQDKDGEKNGVVNQQPAAEGSVVVARTENAEMEVEKVETERGHELICNKNGEKKAVVYARPAAEDSVRVTCTENARIVGTKEKQEVLWPKDGKESVKLLSHPEGSVRVASTEKPHVEARRNVKQFRERIREITSESRFKPASKEIIVKERIEKKFSVRPGIERKPEGLVSRQLGKSLPIKEARESKTSPKLFHDEARRNVKQFKPAGSLGEFTGKERIEKKISVRQGSDIKLEGHKAEQLGKSLSIKEGRESKPSLKLSHDEGRRNAKQIRERAQEECNEKKILVRSSLERKLEGHDRKQLSKSLSIKEAQESKPSPELRTKSGIKIVIKVGGREVGNPVTDAKFVKRKLTQEAENRVFVSSNQIVGLGGLKTDGDRRIVQTHIAAENYPPGQARKSSGTNIHSIRPENLTKRGKSWSNNSDFKGASASRHRNDENEKDSAVYKLPPVVPLKPNHKASCSEYVSARRKVKRVLRLFQVLARTLLQGDEKSKGLGQRNRIDLKVAGILKDENKWVNRGKPILGAVPGVEVGDEFHYRVELSIVGLHRPFQGGIDRTKKNSMDLATSIVASGGYPDDMDSSDVLIYNGSGGTAIGKSKELGDQKLERGNLALKNSMDAKNPVRVIRGFKEVKESEHDGRVKPVSTFTYDGLYLVEKYWTEIGPHGFSVFKFQLRRMSGQPELALKEAKRSKMAKVREGLFQKDISHGKETMPICALNTTDDDRPTHFTYITKNIYPAWYVHETPKGCDCTDGCLDNEKCACAVKNGGGIPFNYNGAIVQAKPLVYECGPSCKCRSCYNRVSQHGIKIPLEIFKTKSRGWGVRSLYSIPSGSFICEYIGELLKESDAQDRVNDEYLFEISRTYEDMTLLEGLSSLIPGLQSNFVDEPVADVGFTIDAAKYGNIGRFINHSCSPNIYAQNVLFDHDDKRMPHIMFFAADNIPPLQELAYDYNYRIDQVHDSEGNIKRKNCYCGSTECTGRLY